MFVCASRTLRRLHEIVMEPNHAILRQSYEPRFTPDQENWRDHAVNADGYGIGWFRESDAAPFLYRAAGPPWNDCNLADMVDFGESHASCWPTCARSSRFRAPSCIS
jgi:glutamine amidotransferase